MGFVHFCSYQSLYLFHPCDTIRPATSFRTAFPPPVSSRSSRLSLTNWSAKINCALQPEQ